MATLPSALRKPVRNKPTVGNKHVCKLEVEIDGKMVDLNNESVVRSLNVENGTIFTCEAEVTDSKGNVSICGKEYALHYPTKFAWKLRRVQSDENGETQTATPAPAPAATAPKASARK